MGRRGLCEKLVVPRGSHPSPPQDPVVDMVSLGSRQSHLLPPTTTTSVKEEKWLLG